MATDGDADDDDGGDDGDDGDENCARPAATYAFASPMYLHRRLVIATLRYMS